MRPATWGQQPRWKFKEYYVGEPMFSLLRDEVGTLVRINVCQGIRNGNEVNKGRDYLF